ncbi:MAG: c-type cytochrome [Planctomycetes bacterium]|nr:c-type cytochrome [Planctomycetota bacterium]
MTVEVTRKVSFGGRLLVRLAGFACLTLDSMPLQAQETAEYFKRNCANCHTIGGGRLVGPDLKNVGQRKDKEWLTRFLLNPKAVMDSGDAYAGRLFQDSRGVLMPTAPDISAERADNLLVLIEAESKLERSQFAGALTAIPDRPFTEQEMEHGRLLFVGLKPLANGGAACLSCHSVQGASILGGGQLGPDLTAVWNKLQGRKGLAAWLSSPPTPTMQPVYKNHPLDSQEILELVAYLESAKDERETSSVARFNFFLLGLAGTAGGFVLFDFVWRRRFRAVRRDLVHAGEESEDT